MRVLRVKAPFIRRRVVERQLDAADELIMELRSRIHRATTYLNAAKVSLLGGPENALVRELLWRLNGES